MKKRYIVAATVLALLGISTSACSSNSSSSSKSTKTEKTSSKSTKTEKTVKHTYKKSVTKPKAKKGFVGNTYTCKDGIVKINKITNVKVNDGSGDPSNYTAVVVEATFTNKSKKAVSPEDFMDYNIKISQVFDNKLNELDFTDHDLDDSGTQWDAELKNTEEDVLPGKTVNFAMENSLTETTDKVTNDFEVQALDQYNQDLGKPYKVKAGTASAAINQD